MDTYLLLTAGGYGTRMNTGLPKQFIPINGLPVLMRSIKIFHEFDPRIKKILVLPEEFVSLWKDLCTEFNFDIDHQIVRGGKERFFSVQNGLRMVPDHSIVLIHDGVRPLVNNDTIERVIETTSKLGNAIPYIDVNQTVRKSMRNGKNIKLNRQNLHLIQTPQGFKSELIKSAYNHVFRKSFTDDASVLEATGEKINLVKGNYTNIKITHPADIIIAEALLNAQ